MFYHLNTEMKMCTVHDCYDKSQVFLRKKINFFCPIFTEIIAI